MKLPTKPGCYWWRQRDRSKQWNMLRVSMAQDGIHIAVWFMGDTAPVPVENMILPELEIVKCEEPTE